MIGKKKLNINLDIFDVAGGNYDLNYLCYILILIGLVFRKYPDFLAAKAAL